MSVSAAIDAAARERGDLVTAAALGRPKAWGALAAHGVLVFRQSEGRAATDEERRVIWAGLWERVEAARRERAPG